MNQQLKRWPFITSILVVVGSALLGIGCDFFLISLTWFVIAALCMAGFLVWCVVAIATIVLIFATFRKPDQRTHNGTSAMGLVVALMIAPFAFRGCWRADLFFHYNRARYEEMASMALQGKLEQKGRDFQLPPDYRGLSATRSVWLYRRNGATDVMFITAGLGGEISGYVYSSDAQPPLPGAESHRIWGGGKHWYHGSNDGCEILEDGYGKRDESSEQNTVAEPPANSLK